MDDQSLNQDRLLLDETLLSTGNGYIGIRGNFEEGYAPGMQSVRGNYINGFYDTVNITYGENAYGFPQTAQKIVNVMDPQTIEVYIGDEKINLFSGNVTDLKRHLDITKGIATRSYKYETPKGHKIEVAIKRMVSFDILEAFIIDYEVKSLNYSGPIRFLSSLNTDVSNYTNPSDPRVGGSHAILLDLIDLRADRNTMQALARTKRSNLTTALTCGHNQKMTYQIRDRVVEGTYDTYLEAGEGLRLVKYAVFTDQIRHKDPAAKGAQILSEVMKHGVEAMYIMQEAYLKRFWQRSKIHLDGSKDMDYALNYSVYALLAAAGKDPFSNIAAKGLSGEGYEGHYFWDTEVYMLPFFILTNPEIARNLLMFRYTILPKAKDRARMMGHEKGAKIPWRTIAGTECSGYFPAGSAQYHINADVAYAYLQYYYYTLDDDLMLEAGLELLYETALLWLDMGYYDEEGQFVINDVTGPDEYTAIVNNNYYTNAMAQYHMEHTVKLHKIFKERHPKAYLELVERIGLKENELVAMDHAAMKMALPYDTKLGIHLQDDSFMQKKPWDFDNTPEENYPLLLHYHPLTIYRHKVLKQADTVLAHLLLDSVSDDIMERSFDYYEQYTTHDSSLSYSIYSMMAARIGRSETAFEFLKHTLRLDLDNLHHNTKDGLHIANAGGAYMSFIYGYAGVRIKEDGLYLRPIKPVDFEGFSFSLLYRKSLLTIELKEQVKITTDQPLLLHIYGKEVKIENEVMIDYK